MTRNSIVAWVPIVLILFLAALTFWLMRVVDIDSGALRTKNRHEPDAILENFTVRQLGMNGKERYTLTADKMLHFADDDSAELRTVAFLAQEENEAPISVQSARARLTSKADEIFFTDAVILVREAFADNKRLTVETSYLHVIPEAGIGKTDRELVLREGGNTVTASGMELNNKTRIATLSKVKATYHGAK